MTPLYTFPGHDPLQYWGSHHAQPEALTLKELYGPVQSVPIPDVLGVTCLGFLLIVVLMQSRQVRR